MSLDKYGLHARVQYSKSSLTKVMFNQNEDLFAGYVMLFFLLCGPFLKY